jgi:hypothetical protein
MKVLHRTPPSLPPCSRRRRRACGRRGDGERRRGDAGWRCARLCRGSGLCGVPPGESGIAAAGGRQRRAAALGARAACVGARSSGARRRPPRLHPRRELRVRAVGASSPGPRDPSRPGKAPRPRAAPRAPPLPRRASCGMGQAQVGSALREYQPAFVVRTAPGAGPAPLRLRAAVAVRLRARRGACAPSLLAIAPPTRPPPAPVPAPAPAPATNAPAPAGPASPAPRPPPVRRARDGARRAAADGRRARDGRGALGGLRAARRPARPLGMGGGARHSALHPLARDCQRHRAFCGCRGGAGRRAGALGLFC